MDVDRQRVGAAHPVGAAFGATITVHWLRGVWAVCDGLEGVDILNHGATGCTVARSTHHQQDIIPLHRGGPRQRLGSGLMQTRGARGQAGRAQCRAGRDGGHLDYCGG